MDSSRVKFLEYAPITDNVPDKSLLDLPVRKFNDIESTNDSLKPEQADYRIAYGMDFLYLLIEINSDSVIYRDRAYQNGDGFIITVAKPKPGNDTADEFYVLGFSPPVPKKNIKQHSFIWYRNIDLSFQPLKQSCVSVIKSNGKIYYQAIIYWKEIYPFHPLFTKIGFNICFVKAHGDNDKIFYFDILDEKIESEQSKRLYEVLDFENPSVTTQLQSCSELSLNHLSFSDSLHLYIVNFSPCDTNIIITTDLRDKNNSLYWSENYNLHLVKGMNLHSLSIPVKMLVPDNYSLSWSSGNSGINKNYFTLLPEYDGEAVNKNLKELKDKISEGSFNTLCFMKDDLNLRFENLKQYETCPDILNDENNLLSFIKEAVAGRDNLLTKEGLFRRGFYSNIDSTFRPYTIRVPADFDRNKKYPVNVYLHGSGDDDRVAFKMNALTNSDIIELYPNGRGTSNLYCTGESQIDIQEALKDVKLNYPVDTNKIILSGFSMGGYGVYRTFYETPGVYKALAIFSGHPNLPSLWLGDGYPDFLNEKYLDVFNGKKIFIFHGTQDRNCPFELTLKLVDKLKNAGADVEFVSEETGHSQPSEISRQKFLNWLSEVIKP
ncbi:MAG: prolyl oligopeptidase family serine peptidase [Ignavibacteria bacterium]